MINRPGVLRLTDSAHEKGAGDSPLYYVFIISPAGFAVSRVTALIDAGGGHLSIE